MAIKNLCWWQNSLKFSDGAFLFMVDFHKLKDKYIVKFINYNNSQITLYRD